MKSRLASLFLDEEPNKELIGKDKESDQMEPYTLLMVDDEPEILNSLKRVFFQENYRILTATSGEEAIQILSNNSVHVIISDHRMPGMTGAEFLGLAKQKNPETIRIMLTGYADISAVMGAINTGAVYKFITKPWNDEDLRITISLAIEQHDLLKENRRLKKQAQKKSAEIKKLSRYVESNRSQLLKILVQSGKLSIEQQEKAKKVFQKTKKPFTQILTELEYIKEAEIAAFLKSKLNIDKVSPKEFQPQPVLFEIFPLEVCRKNCIYPLQQLDQKHILLAMADPTDYSLLEDIRFISGFEIIPAYAQAREIEDILKNLYRDTDEVMDESALQFSEYDPYESIEIVIEEEEDESLEEVVHASETPPAIRLVNLIIMEALKARASDIHIEKRMKYSLVRFRVDGLLKDHIQIPEHLHQPLVSRIKVMAELDISERRKPQDGRITVKFRDRIVDIRLSTLPTMSGEKVVMRILDRNATIRSLGDLGLCEDDLPRLRSLTQKPQGMILATGPTGSGKTTTLYALLYEHSNPRMNYVTIEDPVEYYLEYAGQVLVKEKIGLNFASILRAILRQDPNVILLGEIRDFETAEVSFHAALTGHLVLSTIHTIGTVATVARLLDLGVKPFVIASGLEAVIAQRLVRRLCPHCSEEVEPDPEVMKALGLKEIKTSRRSSGCKHCSKTGYLGRIGLFEILSMNSEMRKLIATDFSENEFARLARLHGLRTLLEDGISKVEAGLTSLEEILRVLGPKDLLMRTCPACSQPLEEMTKYCPYCGETILLNCPHCAAIIDPRWTFCSHCGKEITG
jgi:type II secretory ATPase GspE/PulE/Tfp pilus assembly ATPase PilB-like protein/FixJ family two-component response regulator